MSASRPQTLPIFQVDAFSSRIFAGNPAAVVPLASWLEDETLQRIAEENNLSETAFYVPVAGLRSGSPAYELRWFTPTVEVELCGHATLATAFVIFNGLGERRGPVPGQEIVFESRQSGTLKVRKHADLLELDFPRRTVTVSGDTVARDLIRRALGETPEEVYLSSNDTLLAVLSDEAQVARLDPDMRLLLELGKCLSVTAPGQGCDFVTRYFAPTHGIPEDPVTGSAFTFLAPYWAERLGKDSLHAYQTSRRGGEVYCRMEEERVRIAGAAALYLEGRIRVG